MYELGLKTGEEQSINVSGYNIRFHFNPFQREWLFDMTDSNGVVQVVNCVLRPNTWSLRNIDSKYDLPQIAMIDKTPESTAELNPLLHFGDRLGVFQMDG